MKKKSEKNKDTNNNTLSFEDKVVQELKEINRKIDDIYEFSLGIVGMDAAAKLLNISKAYLYQLTATNRIPFHKRAKLNYIVVKELIEWIKQEDHKRKNGSVLDDQRADNLMLEKFN